MSPAENELPPVQYALVQYSPVFLANCFGLTLKQAIGVLERANGSRDGAAELARRLRYPQPS